MSLEYEEEFTIGMTPEEVYRIIINGTDRNKQ